MVAANILNKQSRTADNGWFPVWGLGMGLTTPRRKNVTVTKCFKAPRTWTDSLAQNRVEWGAFVGTVMDLRVP
jgi:hypothetical protein